MPTEVKPTPPPRFGLHATTALVVASMVGTGVFTTTGTLVESVPSAPALLLCWALAGLAALTGALTYAELGTALPSSGGEAHFLAVLIHPGVGFVSAFVSLVVGFAAPLAVLGLAFGAYLRAVAPGTSPGWAGGALIVVASALSALRVAT
ncbi:MAG: amino acid permease, partial [Myxococcota bacterium]